MRVNHPPQPQILSPSFSLDLKQPKRLTPSLRDSGDKVLFSASNRNTSSDDATQALQKDRNIENWIRTQIANPELTLMTKADVISRIDLINDDTIKDGLIRWAWEHNSVIVRNKACEVIESIESDSIKERLIKDGFFNDNIKSKNWGVTAIRSIRDEKKRMDVIYKTIKYSRRESVLLQGVYSIRSMKPKFRAPLIEAVLRRGSQKCSIEALNLLDSLTLDSDKGRLIAQGLWDKSNAVQCTAAKATPSLVTDEIKDFLISTMLADNQLNVQSWGASAVKTLISDDLKKKYIDKLFTGEPLDELIEGHLAQALSSVRDTEMLSRYIPLGLSHPNDFVVRYSALSIRYIGNDRSKVALIDKALESDNEQVRYTALSAFVLLEDPLLKKPYIQACIESSDTLLMQLAASELSSQPEDSFKKDCITLLLDTQDREINQGLIQAILSIKDELIRFELVADLFERNTSLFIARSGALISSFNNDTLKSDLISKTFAENKQPVFNVGLNNIKEIKSTSLRAALIKEAYSQNYNFIKSEVFRYIHLMRDAKAQYQLVLNGLDFPDTSVESAAAVAIKNVDNTILKAILIKKALQSSNLLVRQQVLLAISKVDDDELRIELINLGLNQQDFSLQEIAARQISLVENDVKKEALIRRNLKHSNINVQLYAADAINTIASNARKEKLIRLGLNSVDDAVFYESVCAIATLSDDVLLEKLVEDILVLKQDKGVLIECGYALSEIKSPNADAPKLYIIQMLASQYGEYPSHLVASLSHKNNQNYWLHMGLMSEDHDVQKAAIDIIENFESSSLQQGWKTTYKDVFESEEEELPF